MDSFEMRDGVRMKEVEAKFATVDELRQVLELTKLMNEQMKNCMQTIETVSKSLQLQINAIVGQEIAKTKTGLKELHKQAEVPEKDNWEA